MKIVTDGTQHELTQDEMTVLQLALKYFNEFSLPLCNDERYQQYLDALKHLQELVEEPTRKEGTRNGRQTQKAD